MLERALRSSDYPRTSQIDQRSQGGPRVSLKTSTCAYQVSDKYPAQGMGDGQS